LTKDVQFSYPLFKFNRGGFSFNRDSFEKEEEVMFRKQLGALGIAAIVGISAMGCGEEGSVTGPRSAGADGFGASAKKIDQSGNTIADIAAGFATSANPEFTILVAALQAADLVDVVSSKGQLTVFAPTDAAFGRLFANPDFKYTPEQLLDPANKDILTAVLLYHIAPGKRMSGDVLGSDQINMKASGKIFPFVNAPNAYLRDGSDITPDARLLAQEGLIDIVASNGVIHVIDTVVLPN
jgi:uncharacterized surface protein with fasciclin (FAS1) repeats